MGPGTVPFFDQLEVYGGHVALLPPTGEPVSYRALAARADQIAAELGSERRLVFLEVSNSVDVIAAYLACLRGRHPVCLCPHASPQHTNRLLAQYGGNVRIWAHAGGVELQWRHRDPVALHERLALLLSTSGSTGSSRLVKLSWANIDANARAIADYLGLGMSERAISSLRLNYSYGLSVVNSHLASGGAIVLTEDSVTEPQFWHWFKESKATSFAGVPHTFVLLKKDGVPLDELTSLRYATQAGGRLDPGLVRHFATLAREQGWRFYVMYGQTEAAPRMAYLPPDKALDYPDCIGVPIPNGRFQLIDEQGRPVLGTDTPGELAYVGPNVMMGYAQDRNDLSTDVTPPRLLTGDIGCRNEAGFFYIVGRASRFVKPFGLRVNLDDLETMLRVDLPDARCAGSDERIVIAVLEHQNVGATPVIRRIAEECRLPEFLFKVVAVPEIPLLPTGKVDYQRVVKLGTEARPDPPAPVWRRLQVRPVFTKRFAREYARAAAQILGLRRGSWESVGHIYRTILATHVSDADSFRSLGGDSLSYVQATVALEEYLGKLPAHWENLSVRRLESERLVKTDAVL